MEVSDITAVFFAQEEVPMALLFGPETIVPGRRVAISCLGATFDRVKVLEALRTLFPSQLQVIVWKSTANEAITIESMNFEQMEAAVAYKAASESTNLLGDSQEEFNILRAQYLSAINDAEREGVLQNMKKLLFDAVLQNLSTNCLKSFGSYEDSSLNLKMCALDYRKLFTMDKAKIQPIQNRINRALARAALPRISDDVKPSPDEAKVIAEEEENSLNPFFDAEAKNSGAKQYAEVARPGTRAPSGRIRKQIADPSSSSSDKDSDSSSSSSVEYPVEGAHTDSDCDFDGNSTPIIVQTIPAPIQQAQPKEAAVLPRSSKKSKKQKKSKKSKKSSLKPQPKKSRVSSKKSKKHKNKKSKKPLPPLSSSSSSVGSDSESEDSAQAVANVDQVLLYKIPFVLLL